MLYNRMQKDAFVEEKTMMAAPGDYGGHLHNMSVVPKSNCAQMMHTPQSQSVQHNFWRRRRPWTPFLPDSSLERRPCTPFLPDTSLEREDICQNDFMTPHSGHAVPHLPEQKGLGTQDQELFWGNSLENYCRWNTLPLLAKPSMMLADPRIVGHQQHTFWKPPAKGIINQNTFRPLRKSLPQKSYVPNLFPVPEHERKTNDFLAKDPKSSRPVLSHHLPVTSDLFIENIVQEFSNDFAHDYLSGDQRIDDYKHWDGGNRPVRQVYRCHAKKKPVQELHTERIWGVYRQPVRPEKEKFWVPDWPGVSSITRLPEDVMIHALLYLSESALWRIYRTCKLFKRAYFRQEGHGKIGSSKRILFFAAQGYRFPKLQKLKIERLHFPTRNILVNEFHFPALKEVELAKCFLPHFSTHPKVGKLRVTDQFHTDMLSFYPNIRRLTITGISNIELGTIVHLLPKTLQNLTLDVSAVRPGDWEVLGELTELVLLSLWIGQNKDIKRHEPDIVEIPASLVKLQSILIRGLETTPDIPPLPALEVLTLEKIDDLDIKELPLIKSLKTLELYRCGMDFWDIHLFEAKYPNLKALLLCPLDDEMDLNLDLFPDLAFLRDLTLSDVRIVLDRSRRHFPAKTPRLTKLTLDHVILDTPHLLNSLKNRGDDINKVSFKSCNFHVPFKLPELVGVKELVFRKCAPLWLSVLASCREVNAKLESMTITKCGVKETGLWNLNKFPNLVKLDLSETSLRTENIPRLHRLERLTMVSCNLNSWDVGRLLTNFPALVALDLSKNKTLAKAIAKKHDSQSINFLNRVLYH